MLCVATPVVTALVSDVDSGAIANLTYALSPQSISECLHRCAVKVVQCCHRQVHRQVQHRSPAECITSSVEPLTAIVASTAPLDRESMPVYFLVVVVTDSSADGSQLDGKHAYP
eukprot:scpid103097/ scgid9480/ 